MSYLGTLKRASIRAGVYKPARFLHRHLLRRGQWRAFRRDVAFFSRIVEAGSVCFDVGANIGEKSEALLAAGERVVAFEPQPDCFEELVARCGPRPEFAARRTAMGAMVGEATFYINEARTASSLRADWQGAAERSILVPVTTLDAAIAEFGAPSYCKIDVEGWESEVLAGLSRPIPLVSFEYHLSDPDISKVAACLDHLSRLGTLSINLTPAEEPEFALPQWLSREDFLALFPSRFRGDASFFYGNIFARIA